ncbi:hypothetical protein TIFTF001_008632 [Ficus carica]|uniref:Uncharacterized protein n=1 Tax=Ficus carica TaxID=3494 RepID=A0AA87ZTT4_FICCA|nr:hypothetical protein TIFTF001_008632 [Ficus carica]
MTTMMICSRSISMQLAASRHRTTGRVVSRRPEALFLPIACCPYPISPVLCQWFQELVAHWLLPGRVVL